MTSATHMARQSGKSSMLKRGIGFGVVVILLTAMGLCTKVVPDGATVAAASGGFSADTYGSKEFPNVRKAITARAAPAPELVAALAKDQDAAIGKYGVPSDIAPVLSVEFTGTVGEGEGGIYTVKVAGVPDDQTIRLQLGPAINGTALRDGVGGIGFGDFKNQIEYQNAAASINDAMKKAVLSHLDRDHLTGKQVTVVGAFQMIIPSNWLVTPVQLSVSP